MNKKIFLFVIVILALGLSSVYAGNANRIGTAGAQELLIPSGSRGVSMGGAVVANSSGVDAIYWNPAGMAYMEGTEAMFTHLPYLADIDIEYAAIATHIEDFGKLGVSVKVVDIGDMEETTEDYPDGTGRIYSPTYTVIGLTYARTITARVNFGITANMINEEIFEVSATGFSFDFGFTYETTFPGLTLGFVMKNYGPDMKFTGSGFDRNYEEEDRPTSSENATFELPTSINMGMAYNFLNSGPNSATLSGNFRANNQSYDYWQGGLEYAYDDRYFLRGGYNFSDQDGYIYGTTLGAGLNYNLGETQLSFEYSWTETDVFEDNQYFTVKVSF